MSEFLLMVLSWAFYVIGFSLLIVGVKLLFVSKNKISNYLSGLGGIKEVVFGDNKMEGEVSVQGEAYKENEDRVVTKKSYSVSYISNLLE